MSSQVPEPFANPGVLDEPTGTFETVHSRVGTRRLGSAYFIVGLAWVSANSFASGTLSAAKIGVLEPDEKVFWLGLVTALGGVFASIALFGWGAISDLTRSRFGARTPWIVFGAVAGTVSLVGLGLAGNIGTFIAVFIVYTLVVNSLVAAVLATFPDRIPREKRGTLSTVYGGAQVLGGAVANIAASQFLFDPNPMYFVGAGLLLVGGLVFVVLAPDFSNRSQPRRTLDMRGMLASFTFPKHAPDFYWAFAGRFALLLGLFMVQNFSLYILSDFIGLEGDELKTVVALNGVASLVTIVLGTVIAGPLSDRIKRRKLPVFVASILFGVAVLLPFTWHTGTSMIVFGAVSGFGLGAFLAVDTALMTEVLPSEESRGKDLGILNAANTVPGIIAPLATSAIVSSGAGYPPVFIASLVIIVVGAFSIFKIKSVR
ncbi:MFS transporter [Curtobacterium pusillum]|uniref:MFS transporter n=1 Tax=Curtobacterium pusillum TaxID=69373 RepID=UPI00380131DC